MGFPWAAADQLTAADLNAAFNVKQVKKNSGGLSTGSGVDLDTVSITGLSANDFILVKYSFATDGNITNTGDLTLVNNTDSVTIGGLLNSTTGLGPNNAASGFALITAGLNDATGFVINVSWGQTNLSALAGSETTNRDLFKVTTGHTTGFTGTWTLALHKGVPTGTTGLYWRWHVLKFFN